jgi:sigma-B regulation protein RsbU (phosphoserine phosphatase)
VYDLQACAFRYVAAGHPGPIHLRDGAAPEALESGGPPVGLLPDAGYEERVVALHPGDRLFLATDGLWEAENAAGQEFGWKKLLEACERNRRRPLDETLDAVIASAGQWCAPVPFADDVAMLAIECE